MSKKPKTIDEVFYIYGEARVDLCGDSIWVRFDHEFVRVMNAENMLAEDLAKQLRVPWRSLNSPANRQQEPKWMTPFVLSAMAAAGFDIDYILINERTLVLKPEELALIDNYRNTNSARQASLREVSTAFAEPKLSVDADGTYGVVGQ